MLYSKQYLYSLVFIFAFTIILTGCGSSNTNQQKTSTPAFSPAYKVIDEKDVSTGYAVRRIMRISVPLGLDRKAMHENIMFAAKSIERIYTVKDKGFVADVYVFTHEDVAKLKNNEFPNPVAECTYAPGGDWKNSLTKYSPDNMKATIHIQEDYYNRK